MPGPVDALHLLRDRELVAYACDPSRNQAWARADARTKDPYDKRVIDRLREGQRGDVLVDEVQRLLALPTPELERVLREEPVRLSTQKKAGHKPRIVAIPSFMRRCMSYVIYRVLSLTSARVYTPIALAYRPGRPQPVQQAIRLVSRAVADGKVRFWAKLDFKGFFNAVPWWAIERSLRRLGHPESFVQTVMVLVRCRVVEVKRGRWDDHDVQQGAQQGLPESAVLANLVAHELDEQLLDLGPELTALRYSDDIFLGTPTHQPVRKAVGVVRSWAARLGILLKDERPGKPEGGVVSQDMALKQLVFDIRERPIHLLGAQIDHLGRVQPAKDRLTSKMEALTGISTKVQHAGVIQGVSLYGDGRGVKVYDQDDLERQVEGFLTYWRDLLDEGNALRLERYMRDKFLDSVREETTSRSQATTWAASLWSPQTDGKPVSGPTGASAMEVSPSQEGEGRAVQQSPGASSSPPAGPGPLTGQGQGGRGAGEGILQLEEEEPGSEPTGAVQGAVQAVRQEPAPGTCSVAASLSPNKGARTHAMRKTTPERAEVGSLQGSGTDEGWKPFVGHREVDESEVEPEDTSNGSTRDSTRFPSGLSPEEVSQMFGEINYEVTASDNIPREEPPLPKLFENNEVLYLDTRRGPEGTCLVGTMMIMRGEVTRTPSVEVHSGRPEALLVRAILERLEHQTGPLVVALTTADLPKSLLQQHRRFHAPYYYWLVLTLHEMARRRGLDVRLVGPVRPPAALTRSLEDAEDVAHRQTASRRQRRA